MIFLMVTLSGLAQHNHSDGEEENDKALIKHSAPHDGEIIDVGKEKLEVLINPMQLDEKLTIYVLKKNFKLKPFTKATGSVICRYKDGKTDTIGLLNQTDRFTTNQIDFSKTINMIFNFTLDSKNINGVYFYKGFTKN